ncbi:transcriptional regulator [Sphingomonas montanisoli]|uniref:Helix-turn-helix domain-containing protein n=1 Tax=Sphingomonas montanisoli TaxID=2606412 RepID=A0A5D9C4G6_9SPHN|nr:YdaS family helix-turn-helix protein [Sphingomonas montanisoli]TZG24891.1 helix-turn-helix domain-containing protein [Sphingomonas montanisoli]
MATKLSPHAEFREAVRKAGGQTAFAAVCGCTQGNIWQLLKKGSELPAQYVLPVERAGFGSRYRLRPDLYPREQTARRRTTDRVAVCSVPACNRRDDDPAAQCCAVRDCPFAVKEAA